MSFRPGLIFGSVFLICISMIIVLPLAATQGSGVAQAAPAPIQPTVEQAQVIDPTATVAPPVEEQPLLPVNTSQKEAVDPQIDADLAAFIGTVQNGQANTLVGVYVPGVLGLRVVEQPVGNDTYVSVEEGTVTRYGLPAGAGVTALLAHNYLSGRDFIKIQQGQQVYLVFGDGQVARYVVSTIEFYQAHSPNDPHSNFTNLNTPGGEMLTYQDLYRRMYTTAGTLVFQTCLEANGDLAWGRTFIIAQPG